jgi:signal transduction histidine kinase
LVKTVTQTAQRSDETSLATIRRQLNELRRQARQLERPALEECLSLAVALANPKTQKQ